MLHLADEAEARGIPKDKLLPLLIGSALAVAKHRADDDLALADALRAAAEAIEA